MPDRLAEKEDSSHDLVDVTCEVETTPTEEKHNRDGHEAQDAEGKSFASSHSDFWFTKNYQKVLDRHLKGHSIMDELAKMMQERILLHYNYTTTLNAWQEKWRTALIKSGRESTPGVKWTDHCELKHYNKDTQMAHRLVDFLEFIEEEGRVNSHVMKCLENQVAYPLSQLAKKNYEKSPETGKTFYETSKADLEANYKNWNEKYEKIITSKKKYISARENYIERLRKLVSKGNYESLGNVSLGDVLTNIDGVNKENLLPEEVTSDRKLQKLNALRESAYKAYRGAYEEVKSYSPVYENTMRDICNQFLEKEDVLVDTIFEITHAYASTVVLNHRDAKTEKLMAQSQKLAIIDKIQELQIIRDSIGFDKPLLLDPFEESTPQACAAVPESGQTTNSVSKTSSKSLEVSKNTLRSVAKLMMLMKGHQNSPP